VNGLEGCRRRGPLLELAPGCWITVAGVTAILPADPADGADGLAVLEADGHPYAVRLAPAAVAQAVADALLAWARERAQAEEEGRLLALDNPGGSFRDEEPSRRAPGAADRPPDESPNRRSPALPATAAPDPTGSEPPTARRGLFLLPGESR
jgi:hypothetical protein